MHELRVIDLFFSAPYGNIFLGLHSFFAVIQRYHFRFAWRPFL